MTLSELEKKIEQKIFGCKSLTKKEKHVCLRICQGMSLGEISDDMKTVPGTVSAQKKSLRAKLGAAKGDVAIFRKVLTAAMEDMPLCAGKDHVC